MGMWEDCLDSKMTICLYFASVLVLLILIVFHLKSINECNKEQEQIVEEAFIGRGLGLGGGYGGQAPSTHRFAQEISSSNQGMRNTVSNAEIAEIAPEYSGVGRAVDVYRPRENLVSTRGEPDFWVVSDTLGRHQRGESNRNRGASAKAKNKSKKEDFRSSAYSAVSDGQDRFLASLL